MKSGVPSVSFRMFNLIRRYTHWLHTRWTAGAVEKLPEWGEFGVTNIAGCGSSATCYKAGMAIPDTSGNA